MSAATTSIRHKVHALADQLPGDATWNDVRYQIDLCASIERGLAESEAGQTTSHEDILKEFGIAE